MSSPQRISEGLRAAGYRRAPLYCTDKIGGQPMFYANPSFKKAKIGYRGAWPAFGTECEFPGRVRDAR